MLEKACRTEGLVLKAFDFQDYDKILTVFSQDLGLIKLVVKKANSKPFSVTPLTRAEFVITKGNSDLYKCHEISLVNGHLALRNSLQNLEAACDILQALMDTQPAQTAAPDLYALSVSYLRKMSDVGDPYMLAASFRLKILRHDGLLGLGSVCATCSSSLQTYYVSEGQCYCAAHSSPKAIIFDEEEFTITSILAYCQHFTQLQDIIFTTELREKIRTVFLELL